MVTGIRRVMRHFFVTRLRLLSGLVGVRIQKGVASVLRRFCGMASSGSGLGVWDRSGAWFLSILSAFAVFCGVGVVGGTKRCEGALFKRGGKGVIRYFSVLGSIFYPLSSVACLAPHACCMLKSMTIGNRGRI